MMVSSVEAETVKILFVDDDEELLKSIRRLFHRLRRQWEMTCVTSGEMAVVELRRNNYDVLVADIQLPGINGAELLEYAWKEYPHITRMVLTGYPSKENSLLAARMAHRFLSKPCDPQHLLAAIQQQQHLSAYRLSPEVQEVVAGVRSLPSLPSLYLEIIQVLDQNDASAERVGQVVARDPGMVAKVLQLVNSAFFGLPRNVSDPVQATVLLGLETIRDLVLSLEIFSQFNEAKLARLGLRTLWDHSMRVGRRAYYIARAMQLGKAAVDQAFTAGMLHDVGKLVLADNYPIHYYQMLNVARQRRLELYQAEMDTFGVTHGQVGAYLLGLWGLPESVAIAAAYHNQLELAPDLGSSPTAAVHIANVIDHVQSGSANGPAAPQIAPMLLSNPLIKAHLDDWFSSSFDVGK